MPKPPMPTTGFGGPCLLCGDYVFEGGHKLLIVAMEKHYLAAHGKGTQKSQKKVINKATEMFDRKEYLRGHS